MSAADGMASTSAQSAVQAAVRTASSARRSAVGGDASAKARRWVKSAFLGVWLLLCVCAFSLPGALHRDSVAAVAPAPVSVGAAPPPSAADPLATFGVAMAAACSAALLGLWMIVDRRLMRAAVVLAAETRLIAHGAGGAHIPVKRFEECAELPVAINLLADKLASARRDIDRAVAAQTARAEEQKSRLAAILRDLHEGVLVCNMQHQILLYNQTALTLLRVTGEHGLGLGRNLLQVVMEEPILHTLERLTLAAREAHLGARDQHATARFIGGAVDGGTLLAGQMSLIIQDEAWADADAARPFSLGFPAITGYVVTFADATTELAALGRRDALLREATQGLRPDLANLRAMLEIVTDDPDMDSAYRLHFEKEMSLACNALSERLERISEAYRGDVSGAWPMSDIHSSSLFSLIMRRVAARGGCVVTPTGLPQWLHGDSFSLVCLFDHLIDRLHEATGLTAFDLSVEPAPNWVFFDIAWRNAPPIASSTLESWMAQPLVAALGGLTVGDVLQHHRSDLWSETWREGRARLRAPLPLAQQQQQLRPARPAPRPEFFDFALLAQPLATGALGNRPLDELTYVVFDTETTGLSPSEGDEIIAIAGVRIVNGRILTGETFQAMVNPGRAIRPESIPIHGITDDMVRDKPPIAEVLPRFKEFVSGAVLVAHNAAFDLKFLRMKETSTGVRFDNPVLDTMLLSFQLQGREGNHTLDGISDRLGISVVDRHNALGDSLLTAAVFLRMVEMLRERGFHTLDDAIRGANILLELHARERAF